MTSATRRVMIGMIIMALGIMLLGGTNATHSDAKAPAIVAAHKGANVPTATDWFGVNGKGGWYVVEDKYTYAYYSVSGMKIKFPKHFSRKRKQWRDFAKLDIYIGQSLMGAGKHNGKTYEDNHGMQTFMRLRSDKAISQVTFMGQMVANTVGNEKDSPINKPCTEEKHGAAANHWITSNHPFCREYDRTRIHHSMKITFRIIFADHGEYWYHLNIYNPIAVKSTWADGRIDYRYYPHHPAEKLPGAFGSASKQTHVAYNLSLIPADCAGFKSGFQRDCGGTIWWP